MSNLIQEQLNYLADREISGTIDSVSAGWAMILRYRPLLDSASSAIGSEKLNKWVSDGRCYVFEIGENCGDVFSVNMVKKISIEEHGARIYLKGE